MKTITLKKQIKFEGREITEISLDFDKLSGRAMSSAEKRCAKEGFPAMVSSPTYCMCLAAEACGEPFEALQELRGSDAQAVIMEVQAFLVDEE